MTPTLRDALRERILVLDGAMGTMIQAHDLTAEDFGGAEYEGCNEHLVRTRPDVIRSIHGDYLAAGADVVETNTFGATSVVLAEYGLEDHARELNRRAAELAREAADAHSAAERPRFVAGSMGPTTKTISVTGGVTFDELADSYQEQAEGLLEGGVDCLLVETAQDTLNLKAASVGIARAQEAVGRAVPLMLSCTIEPMGTTLAGQAVDAFWASVEHLEPLTVGLNCATGPEFMSDHLRTLAGLAPCAVSVYPNAGLPDVDGNYPETPESLAGKLERFVDEGWVNVVGGCCGTTPEHVRAMADMVAGRAPRALPGGRAGVRHVSGIEYLEVDPENRPYLVGERTNVIGSRKFKRLIQEGRYEEAAEVGRGQVRAGAHVLDVCLADPDRDEAADMAAFLDRLTRMAKAPLMVDTTDAHVLEVALKRSQGKAIVNSINLEDGEERFREVAPLLRRYGAAVVVGCIDEEGMAVSADRKLEVAERSFRLLTEEYGVPPQDIYFDPLVFPCATGDAAYLGSAVETIEGVRRITERFPECATILGISNVSFGLPTAGREVLNSVFLYRCVQAGLTMAIVNTEKIERYASIPEAERELAGALLDSGSDEDIARFAEHFRDKAPRKERPRREDLPLDERLARCIVEGTKEGLFDDLDAALAERPPLDIINGPLMTGMDEVGRLFNANELIVAEVLQSAEAMKAAVAHLEPHMERADRESRGKIILATVKGDVHDIGKNLVEIILGNNGYEVVNLGIKVPPEDLIKACREHQPDAIGLSGLLVKSAQQMVVTAQDLRAAGVDVPILVGGAALSNRFTATRIAPEHAGPTLYAKDAMQGLDIANQLFGPGRAALLERVREEQKRLAAGHAAGAGKRREAAEAVHEPLRHDFPLPEAPDYRRHVLRGVDPRRVWPYVNPVMLYSKHLGLRGLPEKLLAAGDEKARKVHEAVESLKEEVLRDGLLEVHGVYRYLPAHGDGDNVIVYDPDAPGEEVLEVFEFERQAKTPRRCLSDWVRPRGSGEVDSVALFAVTAGAGVRERAEAWKAEGEYLKSHALQALALETAEAFAELVHKRIRDGWGIRDAPDLTPRDLFRANYRGRRVSFGYPACPELEDQAKLFRLLEPGDIGLELTDGFMMDPEASVSAVVFHHPEAEYFNVRDARQP